MIDPLQGSGVSDAEVAEPVEPSTDLSLQEPVDVDPFSAAIDSALDMPGPDAIRLVYQLATSAARAKARIQQAAERIDARNYHSLMAESPEAKYADILIGTRRRLDSLAQERRRLSAEMESAASRNRPTSIYEMQIAAATSAMEQVAGGMLLFLGLPGDSAS